MYFAQGWKNLDFKEIFSFFSGFRAFKYF